MKTRSGNVFGLVLMALCLCGPPTLLAQERETLGLDALVSMAVSNSPQIREAEQDVLAAKSDLAQANAGRWAQMDVTGVVGPAMDADEPVVVFDTDATTGGKLIGHLEDRDEDTLGIFGRLDLVIAQPLYTFGKISHRRDAAKQAVAAQQAGMEKTRGDVMLNVKELYYGLIVASQGQGAARDADEFIEDAAKRIKKLLAAGSTNVDQSDLYRLESFEAEIKQFKVKAESGERMAYMALKKAVGYPDSKEFKLDRSELPKDLKPLPPQEEYISRALAHRPEIDQLNKGIEAQKSMVDAAKADLYPSFYAAGIGSLAGAPGRDRLDISYFSDEFNRAEFGVVVGTEWHFDFGIGRAKVDKARAEHQKLLHTKDYAERNIPLEVAKYYQDAVEAQSAFQAYGKAATAARRWIVSAFSNFDMGVGTAKDIFDAIERYSKNQGEYLLALYNYQVALARLDHAAAAYLAQ
ncbi:MAG: TolC family protein [Acidobacteriota bacterium]